MEAELLTSSSTELAETTVGATVIGLRGANANAAAQWLGTLEGVRVNEVEA